MRFWTIQDAGLCTPKKTVAKTNPKTGKRIEFSKGRKYKYRYTSPLYKVGKIRHYFFTEQEFNQRFTIIDEKIDLK